MRVAMVLVIALWSGPMWAADNNPVIGSKAAVKGGKVCVGGRCPIPSHSTTLSLVMGHRQGFMA